MASGFIPIEHYRTKFYQKENQSKKFTELIEEHLVQIANKIYRKQEITEEVPTSYPKGNFSKLERYIKVLQYLTNPSIHMEMKTFDERLAFLIMSVDPYLITFKEFLKINLQSIQEISKVENLNERNRLYDERNQTLTNYETAVRNKIGFFDARLLKYEELFFKKFYNERELITSVGQHNEDSFLFLSCLLTSFDKISDERFKELQEKAKTWLSMVPDKYKTKIATYSATNQKQLIGLNTFAEQLAFYILVVDPNLDMLRIYEEESMIPSVEERIMEEFGYYNANLIKIEKKFHERFCPDKKLSIWTETK